MTESRDYAYEFWQETGRWPSAAELEAYIRSLTAAPPQVPDWLNPEPGWEERQRSGQRSKENAPWNQPTTPTTPTMPAANACGAPGTWEYDFGVAHGRCPNEQDVADRKWSEEFAARYGRPPSQADWENHYYENQGGPQPDGEGDGWTGTVADILTKLEFPKTTAELPAYLRGWAGYAQQLFQENPSMDVFPLPEVVNGEVAMFEKGEGDRDRLGQVTTNPSDTLQGLLGFAQGDAELGKRSAEEQWQALLNAMKYAGPEAMQQLASLRYNPDLADWEHNTTGWYRKLISMLPHVEHL